MTRATIEALVVGSKVFFWEISMKHLTQKFALPILLALLAHGLPLVSSGNQAENEVPSSAAAQKQETIKWKFNGNDAGTNTFQTYPDGKFESVTDLTVAGMALKSRLTGRIVDGVITEFEIVNQQGGMEVKTSAKDGKARITVGDKSRDVEYKPLKTLFGNLHPVLTETLVTALDTAKDGIQSIEVFVLDAATSVKVDVMKKKARAIETGGKKQIADVYLVRFPGVEFDVHLAQGSHFAAMDIPSQKLQAIRSGYEAFLIDTTTLYPELSQPTMKTRIDKGVKIKMRDGIELVAEILRQADARRSGTGPLYL